MADPVTLAVTVALNAASMAMTASQKFEGPRLDTVQVTNADYGAPLFYFYGTRKNEGTSVIFAENLREEEHRNKTKGGKYNEFKYFGTWAVLVADHEIDAVLKIWFDEHLVYDATGAGPISPFSVDGGGSILNFMRIYTGTADQDPDPRMLATVEAREGVGSCPAYRGVSYIMFEEVPLEKLGNRMPQVKVLATNNGAAGFPFTVAHQPIGGMQGPTFSSDYSRVTYLWGTDFATFDNISHSLMWSGTLNPLNSPTGGEGIIGLGSDGKMYTHAGFNIVSFQADGQGGGLVYASGVPLSFVQVKPHGSLGLEMIAAAPFGDGVNYLVYNGMSVTTLQMTGVDWQPKHYLTDTLGDVWAVGSTANSICLYCLTEENGQQGRFIQVTAPTTPGGVAPTVTCFCNAAGDFVVDWSNTHYLIINYTSGLITLTDSLATHAAGVSQQILNAQPGASSFWAGSGGTSTEISASTFAVLRTVTMTDWDGGMAPALYDPVNNALFGANTNGIAWYYLDRASGAGVTLQSIVEDVSARSGLNVGTDIDASDCDQVVLGYSWTQGSGQQILEPLLEFFDSEVSPHDFTLNFHKRGVTASGSIPTAQMGASADGKAMRYKIERTLDTDLPLRISLTFADPDIDQQPNTAIGQRHAGAVDSARELSLDLSTLALTATNARIGVDGYLRRKWYAAEAYETSVTRAFSALEPADATQLVFDGLAKTAKLMSLTFQADGVMALKWERYNAWVHINSGQAGAPADGVIPPVVVAVGQTKGFVLDTPLVRDADDGLITYLAAGPFNASVWPGAVFYQSFNAGASYTTEYGLVPSDHIDTWGTTSGALADALTSVWDRGSTLSVYIQDGTLTSTTEAAVENGANRALIGDEQVGFATATLTAPNTYALSKFLRGRRGTEWATATHAAGDRFVLLNSSALVRHVHGASDVGDTLYIKPVTAGSASQAGFPLSLVYTGASLKSYSVAHLKVTDDAGDLVFTWVRRTRIGGEWRDGNDASLGEGSELYEADVLDSGGNVLRSFAGLTSPTVTYSGDQQDTDVDLGVALAVYQMSSTVGRGFVATIVFATGAVTLGEGGGHVPVVPGGGGSGGSGGGSGGGTGGGGGGGVTFPDPPIVPTDPTTIVNIPVLAVATTGAISSGSHALTVASVAGFYVGARVCVEIGGEAGGGLRGTNGVGGVFAARPGDGYYKSVDAPKSLIADILGISGSVLTLSVAASASTSGANVYLDNSPIWDASGAAADFYANNGHTAVFQLPIGAFAFCATIRMDGAPSCILSGATAGTPSDTLIFAPKGTINCPLIPENSNGGSIRRLKLRHNHGDDGYGWGHGYGDNDGTNGFSFGLMVRSDDFNVYDFEAEDTFQYAPGFQYSARGYVKNVLVTNNFAKHHYIQWEVGSADAGPDGNNRFEDVVVNNAWMTSSFETFSEGGSIFLRCGGINVAFSANSAGRYLFQDCYSHVTALAQYNSDSFHEFNPLLNINDNIHTSAPDRRDYNALGGTVTNWVATQAGYSNANNDVWKGASIVANALGVQFTRGSYTAPGWLSPSGGQGALGLISDAPGLVVDGFTVVMVGGALPPSYGANIYVGFGTVKNSTANTIKTQADGGGNTGSVILIN